MKDLVDAFSILEGWESGRKLAMQGSVSLRKLQELAKRRQQMLFVDAADEADRRRGGAFSGHGHSGEQRTRLFVSLTFKDDPDDGMDALTADRLSFSVLQYAYMKRNMEGSRGMEQMKQWQHLESARFGYLAEVLAGSRGPDATARSIARILTTFFPGTVAQVVPPALNSDKGGADIVVPYLYALRFLENHRAAFESRGRVRVESANLVELARSLFSTKLATLSPVFDFREHPGVDEFCRELVTARVDTTATGSSLGAFAIENIDTIAPRDFPLCMALMHESLNRTHLRHRGRLQYKRFLKDVGVTMDQSLAFFRSRFIRTMTEAEYDKKMYDYSIRYDYGKIGRMQEARGYDCVSIVNSQPSASEVHGCPFQSNTPAALEKLLLSRLRPDRFRKDRVEEIVHFAQAQHYGLACRRYMNAQIGFDGLDGDFSGSIHSPQQYYMDIVRLRPRVRAVIETDSST